jgi:hypothetical protein
MMMQMLAAGGHDILADAHRPADDSNPRGYYEYEPVKRSMTDMSWLPDAHNKAVKVIHLLLPRLPDTCSYDVIFMQRDLAEVVASQHAMLRRMGRPGGKLTDEQFIGIYSEQVDKALQWAQTQPNVRLLTVQYHDVIASPREQAQRIASFLPIELNVDAMTAAVDARLYRTKA